MVEGYGRLALGSSGVWSEVGTEGWWDRMGEVMDVVCDDDGRPRVKLHGMRMLNWRVFSRLPLSSADSTNSQRNSLLLTKRSANQNYLPPSRGQRASVIAWITENHQSSETWVSSGQEKFELDYA